MLLQLFLPAFWETLSVEDTCTVQSLFHRSHTILDTEFYYLLTTFAISNTLPKKGVVGMSKYVYCARGVCLAVSIKETDQAEPIF